MALLEILTRCYKRPRLLVENQASLNWQTSDDWMQTLLIDSVGNGINWTHEQFTRLADTLRGDYIWILDDDDICIRPTLVAEIGAIVARHNPDVIMLRMDHGPRGVLPDRDYWGRPPAHAHIGISAYVVRREIWQKHAGAWSPGVYHSDFNFIADVFMADPVIYWHDVIASRVQQIGLGKPEGGE